MAEKSAPMSAVRTRLRALASDRRFVFGAIALSLVVAAVAIPALRSDDASTVVADDRSADGEDPAPGTTSAGAAETTSSSAGASVEGAGQAAPDDAGSGGTPPPAAESTTSTTTSRPADLLTLLATVGEAPREGSPLTGKLVEMDATTGEVVRVLFDPGEPVGLLSASADPAHVWAYHLAPDGYGDYDAGFTRVRRADGTAGRRRGGQAIAESPDGRSHAATHHSSLDEMWSLTLHEGGGSFTRLDQAVYYSCSYDPDTQTHDCGDREPYYIDWCTIAWEPDGFRVAVGDCYAGTTTLYDTRAAYPDAELITLDGQYPVWVAKGRLVVSRFHDDRSPPDAGDVDAVVEVDPDDGRERRLIWEQPRGRLLHAVSADPSGAHLLMMESTACPSYHPGHYERPNCPGTLLRMADWSEPGSRPVKVATGVVSAVW
jgi:hypothetical protein